jgi:hypothetical protein
VRGFEASSMCRTCSLLKVADEIITFFKSFGIKKINEFVVTVNKLTSYFAGLAASVLRLDMARGPSVGQRGPLSLPDRHDKSAVRLTELYLK